MPLEREYEPNPEQWVRDQMVLYESSGGSTGNVSPGIGLPAVILTTREAKGGKIRETPLMRVAVESLYAVVASARAATCGLPGPPAGRPIRSR